MEAIEVPIGSLVVLVGPAGSGKSTFATAHFRPTQIVSSDACRALVGDDPANQSVSKQAFELFHFIIDLRLSLGRLTVADSTALTREARRDLLDIARRHKRECIGILFLTPLERCREWNRRRELPVDEAVLERHATAMEAAVRNVKEEDFDRVHFLAPEDLQGVRIDFIR